MFKPSLPSGIDWDLLPYLVVLLLAHGVIYVVAVVVYRLTLHPLAKYPGPFFAKITDWYQFYYAWKGVKPYSEYLRYGPNTLLINNETALHSIYTARANVRKADFYKLFDNQGAPTIVSSRDNARHANIRRNLAHGFSDSALRDMNAYILPHVQTFLSKLPSSESPKEWGPSRNMALHCVDFTFDVLFDLVFRQEIGQQESQAHRDVILSITDIGLGTTALATMVSLFRTGIDKLLFPKFWPAQHIFGAFCVVKAAERDQRKDQERKDLYHHLLHMKNPETGLPLDQMEILGASINLVLAGSDTTSIAVAATIFYLTQNARVLKKLEHEIRSRFPTVDDITYGPKLHAARYLRACVEEALRMSPSVSAILPRRVLPGGLVIQDHHLPPDIDVATPIYSLHHNEKYFPSPKKYWPERWIAGEEDVTRESVGMALRAFHPFSHGPRACLGKGIAYTEILTAIGRMLFLYDIRREPGSTVGASADGKEFYLRDAFTSVIDGPMVQFKLRA